jgi:CAAX prenyl protease-like protein
VAEKFTNNEPASRNVIPRVLSSMNSVLADVRKSPVLSRVVPFGVFLFLTAAQGWFGESGRYWIYLLKTVVAAWMLWELRDVLVEMRPAWSWEAVVIGILIFVLWVGLDRFYPGQDELLYRLGVGANPADKPATPWNPFATFGEAGYLGWFFVVVRIAGSSLVVPPLEEVLYRSFLYRYLISPEFQKIPLNRFHPMALGITALVFGFAHQEWLPGILCALGYQWLVLRKNRLGDAMTAHGITNFLLGAWIVARGDWKFW